MVYSKLKVIIIIKRAFLFWKCILFKVRGKITQINKILQLLCQYD